MSCLSSLKNRPGTQKETDRNETKHNYQKVDVAKPNVFKKIKGRFENFKTD